MTKIERTFDVRAPPAKVYAEVSEPERWPVWSGFVKQVTSSGSSAHWVYEMGGMKVESDTELAEVTPNAVYSFRQTGGFLKSGNTRIEIVPKGEGSQVSWTMEYELPYSYLGKLVDKLRAKKQFETAMDTSVIHLRKLFD